MGDAGIDRDRNTGDRPLLDRITKIQCETSYDNSIQIARRLKRYPS